MDWFEWGWCQTVSGVVSWDVMWSWCLGLWGSHLVCQLWKNAVQVHWLYWLPALLLSSGTIISMAILQNEMGITGNAYSGALNDLRTALVFWQIGHVEQYVKTSVYVKGQKNGNWFYGIFSGMLRVLTKVRCVQGVKWEIVSTTSPLTPSDRTWRTPFSRTYISKTCVACFRHCYSVDSYLSILCFRAGNFWIYGKGRGKLVDLNDTGKKNKV